MLNRVTTILPFVRLSFVSTNGAEIASQMQPNTELAPLLPAAKELRPELPAFRRTGTISDLRLANKDIADVQANVTYTQLSPGSICRKYSPADSFISLYQHINLLQW